MANVFHQFIKNAALEYQKPQDFHCNFIFRILENFDVPTRDLGDLNRF